MSFLAADPRLRTSPEWRQTAQAALFLILVLAAALRFNAVGLGNQVLTYQIDEAHNVRIPLSLSWGDLDPRAFFLPSGLWYLLFVVDQLAFQIGKAFGFVWEWSEWAGLSATNPLPFFLLGRSVNALVGTATVGLTYVLGRRAVSQAHGLLAAAFLTCTFLHVRDSAVAMTDAPLAFFVLLSVLGAVGVLREGRRRDYLLAGAAAGLAAATKYNGILVLVALMASHGRRGALSGQPIRRMVASWRLVFALLLAALVFVALNPYLFLDRPRALKDLTWNAYRFFREGHVIAEPIDVGPGWWYHFAVSLRYGMGVALLGLAVAGALRVLWRRDSAGLVLLAFVTAFYLAMGGAKLVYVRYMTPLLPILCLFAAGALLALIRRLPWPTARPWLGAGLGLLVVAEPLYAATAYTRLVHHIDTRIQAARFIENSLPPGSRVATYGPSEVWRSLLPPFQPFLYATLPEQSWTEGLHDLEARGVHYFLTHRSALDTLSPAMPDIEMAVEQSGTLIGEFSPARPGVDTHPVYERVDTYYFPIGGFYGMWRAGPMVRLYRLDRTASRSPHRPRTEE